MIRFRPNQEGHNRFGISTGRRLGKAVVRNRVRRRIREALRRTGQAPTGSGYDILVVARQASVEATYPQLQEALDRLIGPLRDGEGLASA
jgi:ribonuclease P protein component